MTSWLIDKLTNKFLMVSDGLMETPPILRVKSGKFLKLYGEASNKELCLTIV